MIPDKIYLGIQDMGSGYVYALSLDNNGEQEYIRKDKIREMVMHARNMSQTPDAAIRNWDLLIQEIDEL